MAIAPNTNDNITKAGTPKFARTSPAAVSFSANALLAQMPTAQKNEPALREKKVVESVLNMAIVDISLSNTP